MPDDAKVTEHEEPEVSEDLETTGEDDNGDFSAAFEEALTGEDDLPLEEADEQDEDAGEKEGEKDSEPEDDTADKEEEADEDLERGKRLLEDEEKEPPKDEGKAGGKDAPKGEAVDDEPEIITSKKASIYAKLVSPQDFEPKIQIGDEEVDVRDYLETNPEVPIIVGTYMQRVLENLLSGGVLADGQAAKKEMAGLRQEIDALRYELRVAAKAQDVFDVVESKEFKEWQKTAPKEALALFRSKSPADFARGVNLYKKSLTKKQAADNPKAKERDKKARDAHKNRTALLSHKSGKSIGTGAGSADDFSTAFREASDKENEIEL